MTQVMVTDWGRGTPPGSKPRPTPWGPVPAVEVALPTQNTLIAVPWGWPVRAGGWENVTLGVPAGTTVWWVKSVCPATPEEVAAAQLVTGQAAGL